MEIDFSHEKAAMRDAVWEVAGAMQRPSVLYRPRIFLDGNMWCALYGDNLQDGVAGFGRAPDVRDGYDDLKVKQLRDACRDLVGQLSKKAAEIERLTREVAQTQEALLSVAEVLGLDHATAFNVKDAAIALRGRTADLLKALEGVKTVAERSHKTGGGHCLLCRGEWITDHSVEHYHDCPLAAAKGETV